MDDFEDAVETQTLPAFLKQDLDLSAPSADGAAGSGAGGGGAAGGRNVSVGEAELEKLMREMTDEDLDRLAREIGVEADAGKVGLMVPAGEAEAGAEKEVQKEEEGGEPVDAQGADENTRAAEEAEDGTALAGKENLEEVVHDAAVALGEKLGISSAGDEEEEAAAAAGTRQADEVGKGESVDALIAAGERAKGKEKVE